MCGGSGICEHGKIKINCKECGGSQICEHGRVRSTCKECGGSQICEHGRMRSSCKDCRGGSICEHGNRRSHCKECGGGSICEHGRERSKCKECGGGSICEHGRERRRCKECGGNGICEHGRVKIRCKECGGGSICEHGKIRSQCRDCGGGSICEHNKHKSQCIICDPIGHLRHIVSERIRQGLSCGKSDHTVEYLGCSIQDLKLWIEKQFTPWMSWENYGKKWEIDHIIPIKYCNPTIEQAKSRLRYINLQPLLKRMNRSKENTMYIDDILRTLELGDANLIDQITEEDYQKVIKYFS